MDNNQPTQFAHADGKAQETAVGKSALCLSGGGIRSATFSLGVIQGLAALGWLEQFTYLSTVSGGGYIGSWLTSWCHRTSLSDVNTWLKQSVTGQGNEPPEIRRLRSYSNYLSPVSGVSGDMLALVSTLLRNIFFNWLVLIPLLCAVVIIPCLLFAFPSFSDVVFPLAPYQAVALTIAIACSLISIAYATSDLPHRRDHQTKNNYFFQWWLLPTTIGCISLSYFLKPETAGDPDAFLHGAFLPFPLFTSFSLLNAAMVGAIVHLFGVVIGLQFRGKRYIYPRTSPEQPPSTNRVSRFLREHTPNSSDGFSDIRSRGLFAAALSGALTGALIWSSIFVLQSRRLNALTAHSTLTAASDLLYSTLATPALLVSFQLGTSLYMAFLKSDVDEGPREWWGRAGGYTLIVSGIWIGAHVLVLWLASSLVTLIPYVTGAGGLGGLISALTGYFGKNSGPSSDNEIKTIWRALSNRAGNIVAGVFIAALTICLSFLVVGLVSLWTHSSPFGSSDSFIVSIQTSFLALFCSFVGLALFTWGTLWLIPSNGFSLQAMYRNRLVRAYLGSARPNSETRRSHAFTGFDPADDISLSEVESHSLKQVINVSLNISSPDVQHLDWQQRKAASFTFEPDVSGSAVLGDESTSATGYVRTSQYANDPFYRSGISLGRAMALSGAAASPNMGFHTSPLLAFVLAFFNIRLGGWLPNTRRYTDLPLLSSIEPKGRLGVLLAELFGRANCTGPFVYLSDGGHFENLGLYEMVRRRCGQIVVVDASCDPKYQFDDLERAIRLIRTDLGFSISFPQGVPTPRSIEAGALPFATGYIDYGSGEHGRLIYIKPVLGGDESLDIVQYAASCRRAGIPFPHHSTGDQFFNETQFEAYRALGYQIVANSKLPTWSDLRKLASPNHRVGSVTQNSKADTTAVGATVALPGRASQSVSSALSWDSLPVWALVFLLGLPLLHLKREQSHQTLIALLPQEQSEGFNVMLAEQMTLSYGDNRRIMLPLFEEAQNCRTTGATSAEYCKVGEDLTTGGIALLTHLSNVLSNCADSGPLVFHIRGYSSTSDFKDERTKDKSARRNLDLADRRAQKVGAELQAAANKVPQSARPVVLLWSATASQETASKELAKGQYGDSVAVSSYDKTGENINRRVDIELTQMGACTLEQVWNDLRKPNK